MKSVMEFTGERFVPQITGNIKYEHLHRYALALDLAEGRSVLDIASGEGYGSALLAKRADHVIGVDIDVDSANHAQAQYGHLTNLKFLAGSCSAIPVADASIDVVTSFETIEHHDQHEEMMHEIKRVLRADGLLIISSPNRLVYSDEPNYTNPFHVKELYYEEFLDLLKRHFQQVHIYGQRLAVGSCITSLGFSDRQEIRAFSGDIHSLSNVASYFPSPMYFVAVCSDRKESVSATLESIYLDASDDLLTHLQNDWHSYQLALQQIQLEKAELQQTTQQYQADLNSVTQELAEAHHRLQELAHFQENCDHLKIQLENAHQQIKVMESSKFWKLRQVWMRFKRLVSKE
jgi:ubiquinone/menaquinone biosynthesis C-methylase UbiE